MSDRHYRCCRKLVHKTFDEVSEDGVLKWEGGGARASASSGFFSELKISVPNLPVVLFCQMFHEVQI